MSFTKKTFKNNILSNVNVIQEKTINDNDYSLILKYLNSFLEIQENIKTKDENIGLLWNEINFDLISSIHSASSGFYRSAIVTLRSILEMASASIFYYDRKIEYYLYRHENYLADKYVSTLINEYDFFKTKYIKAFYKNIETIEKCRDSVSIKLKKQYSTLSDVVHGRYESLFKVDKFKIKYSKSDFKRYEKLLFSTLSIIAVMYILRFDDFSNEDTTELAQKSGVIEL